MNKLLISAASALSAMSLPTAASAQAAGSILIVDVGRVMSECTACKSASAQLQAKQTTMRARAQTLQQQLDTEGRPLQTAVDALNGKQPDAALKARIVAFQTKEKSAQQELSAAQQTLQSTAENVQQQIGVKLVAVVESVRARRSAAIVLAKNSTMANDAAIDVTTEVLAALNQQVPAVSVTPLPQQQQQQPDGR